MKLNRSENFTEMLNLGYIDAVKHPSADLWIYNYTKSAQYGRVWNEDTMMCRGLIVDGEDNIVARPFRKFFNYEEICDGQIPSEVIPEGMRFKAYEKLDGSLGILYWIGDRAYIATRGSFSSAQAEHATKILNTKYSNLLPKLDRSKTYLFEIVYPENHIVVSYGDTDDIYLLAIIDTDTGEETDIYEHFIGFCRPKLYDGVEDIRLIRTMFPGDNKEGFVIKFDNNYRLKMKFAEYFRLHSLLSSISGKKILDHIVSGEYAAVMSAINGLDEENRIYFEGIVDGFHKRYSEIEDVCKSELKPFDSDKDAAEYIKGCSYPAVLFSMRKGKDYSKVIWKIIQKEYKETRSDEI